eukprot:11182723-Lingulodinium_polyedra.AAC.1
MAAAQSHAGTYTPHLAGANWRPRSARAASRSFNPPSSRNSTGNDMVMSSTYSQRRERTPESEGLARPSKSPQGLGEDEREARLALAAALDQAAADG